VQGVNSSDLISLYSFFCLIIVMYINRVWFQREGERERERGVGEDERGETRDGVDLGRSDHSSAGQKV